MKKIFAAVLATIFGLSLASCDSAKKIEVEPQEVNVSSNSLYVKKVDNLKDDFIFGMDSSQVISLEKSGVKYYDFDGKEQDVFKTLAQNGINYIRVRIWNDPFDSKGNGYGGGNCNVDTAIEIGKRATKYGMKLLVNFHYSDFWADPAKQMIPKAWKNMNVDERANAIYEFTKDSLKKIKAEGIDVGMVQVGNETNAYMCGSKIWSGIASFMAKGSKAVREVFPKALVALHFANPEKGSYGEYADKLNQYKVDYDVFGSSYYPYWHGTLDNLAKQLDAITDKYGKKTMVLETSYAFTSEDTDFNGNTISDGGAFDKYYPFTIQGQANAIRNVTNTVAGLKAGIGVCYWEGTWISVGTNSWEENHEKWEKYGSGWASSYAAEYDPNDAGKYYGGDAVDNQAFFDAKGKPLESLKVFGLMKNGNEIEVKVNATEDQTFIYSFTDDVVFPTKVNAVMTDDSKKQIDVVWKSLYVVNEDTSTTKIADTVNEETKHYLKTHGVHKYKLVGEAQGFEAACYISMVEYNYVDDYSFETGKMGKWQVNPIKKSDQLYIEEKVTDSLTGNYHYHFWSSAKDSVEFELFQEIKDLPSGNYKFAFSIMGGDAGETDIYAFVRINGTIVAKKEGKITSYGEWNTMRIDRFAYTAGDKIEVGMYVKCSGSGNGAWGKIDDALLNAIVE